jgi:diguanylate cyclase (GGDEF)-like protein
LDSAKPGSQAIRIAGAGGQETRCAGSRSDKDIPNHSNQPASSLPQSLPAPQSGWETAGLLDHLDGDEDLIRELLALFQEDSPKELLKAKQCLAEERLAGVIACGAHDTRLVALSLEECLVEARESMRFQATHDLLTSLWNRGVIIDLLTNEVLRSQREHNSTAVIMCDIDHFKAVNDDYGHASGDDVLRQVSRRLHQSVRSYDMVGRYGGEEFLVVLNRCEAFMAISRAENLRAAICAKPTMTATTPVRVSISIGLALTLDFPNSSVEQGLDEADKALYAAKNAGRNCVRLAQPPVRISGTGMEITGAHATS